MYTVKEVGRAGVRRASLGQPVGGQLHRFCFVPEVPTCWGQQATGIACPRAGRGPNQPGPALQSGVLACTAASLRAEGCPAAAEAPLELGLRVLCPLSRSTPRTTPLISTDTWMRRPFIAQPGPGPLRGLLRAFSSKQGCRLSPGSHSESHAFPLL